MKVLFSVIPLQGLIIICGFVSCFCCLFPCGSSPHRVIGQYSGMPFLPSISHGHSRETSRTEDTLEHCQLLQEYSVLSHTNLTCACYVHTFGHSRETSRTE